MSEPKVARDAEERGEGIAARASPRSGTRAAPSATESGIPGGAFASRNDPRDIALERGTPSIPAGPWVPVKQGDET